MLKKFFSLTLLFILSIFFLTAGLGCKGLSQEQQTAIQPVELNYWTVYNDMDQLREFAKEYEAIRPYVKINIRQVRYDEFDSLFVNALADDVSPDIVSTHVRWLNRYQSRLAEMPDSVQVANVYIKGKYAKETVVEMINQGLPSANTIAKEYVGTVPNDVIINGNVYGLPLAIDTLALYYNVDLLDKSGVPEPPETWEDFMKAVKEAVRFNNLGKILQSGVALGTGENISNAFDILSLIMMQNGTTLEQAKKVVTFASGVDERSGGHPTLQALRFYTDFARPTKEVYTWNEEMGNSFDAFISGHSVFYFGFAYERNQIKARAPQMSLAVIEAPQLNESQPTNVANYWVEAVVKKSRHQNEAWDFIHYMTSRDNVKKYTEKTGQPSPWRAHITEQQTQENLAPFVSQLLTATNWYHGKNYEAARDAFNEMISQHLEPYENEGKQGERDAGLLIRAAQLIQQTY